MAHAKYPKALKAVMPALAAVAVLALLSGGLLAYTTSQTDTLVKERQVTLLDRAVRQSIAQVSTDQEGYTLWDVALEQVLRRPIDYAWIDSYIGIWFHTHYHHDEVYLLDGNDAPIYAMQKGLRTQPEFFSRVAPQAQPLVRELREEMRSGPAVPLDRPDNVTGIADVALVAGRPAIVSVTPFVSDTGDIAQMPGSEHLHISVRYLDGAFLRRLTSDLGVDSARFTRQASAAGQLPLTNRAGQAIGYIAWSPFEPGRQVGMKVAPFAGLALVLAGGLLAWLTIGTRRAPTEAAGGARDARFETLSPAIPVVQRTRPLVARKTYERAGLSERGEGSEQRQAFGELRRIAEKYGEFRPQLMEVRDRIDNLTRRQREVLHLVGKGLSSKHAGRVLGLSPRTVEIHKAAVMQKMNARSATELVRISLYARLANILLPEKDDGAPAGPRKQLAESSGEGAVCEEACT